VRYSCLSSLGRRGLRQTLWWRALHVRALFWRLFVRLAWAEPATGLAGKTGKSAALASVLLDGVCPRQVMALMWPLISSSAWGQPATVVAGTTGEGVDLASVRLFGVSPASHCGERHEI
jgi:hypothetical protein